MFPRSDDPFLVFMHPMPIVHWSYVRKMRKISSVLALALFLAGLSIAQSGRKVAPAPKATPQVTQESDEPDYSDSISVKTRISPVRPTLRTAESSSTLPPAANASPSNDAESDVVKVETDLITIPVSVYDRNGL